MPAHCISLVLKTSGRSQIFIIIGATFASPPEPVTVLFSNTFNINSASVSSACAPSSVDSSVLNFETYFYYFYSKQYIVTTYCSLTVLENQELLCLLYCGA